MILYTGTQGKWSSGVVVNMPPCHGGDREFKSRPDRHFKAIGNIEFPFFIF